MLEMFNIHSQLSKMHTFNPSLSTPSLKDDEGTNSKRNTSLYLLPVQDQSDRMHSVNNYYQQSIIFLLSPFIFFNFSLLLAQ